MEGVWKPCKHCTFCGYHGKQKHKSMVPCVSQIMTKKYIPLNQNLTYANFGIYVLTCLTCYQQCNGQKVNTFTTEWSSRPSNWNKADIRDNCDQMVVSRHFSVFHDIINKPHIYLWNFHCYFYRNTQFSLCGYLWSKIVWLTWCTH